MNFKRVNAILIKELQDIRKNANVLVMYVIPVIFMLLYQNFIPGMPEGFALGFSLLFLVVMVGMYVPSMMIAEEKEKKTIEVLILSPAKPAEVFMGKGLLTFLSMMVTLFIMLLASGYGFKYFAVILSGTVLISISCIFIGMMVGLLAQNQMATGIIGLPVYLILIMIPLFSVVGKGVMQTIAKALPTYYYFNMLQLAFTKKQAVTEMPLELGVLAASIVVTFVLLTVVYRKKGLE